MKDFIMELMRKLSTSSRPLQIAVSVVLSALVGLLFLVSLSSCNSATRVVTISSDGTYSVRYIDSKTPADIDVNDFVPVAPK